MLWWRKAWVANLIPIIKCGSSRIPGNETAHYFIPLLVLSPCREMVVFKEGDTIYHSKILSFFRKESFALEASYAHPNKIPYPTPLIGESHSSCFVYIVYRRVLARNLLPNGKTIVSYVGMKRPVYVLLLKCSVGSQVRNCCGRSLESDSLNLPHPNCITINRMVQNHLLKA